MSRPELRIDEPARLFSAVGVLLALALPASLASAPARAQWDIPDVEGVCAANCDYEEPYYEEPYYEEPYYEEPYYEEPYYEPSPEEIAAEYYNAGNAFLEQGDYWSAEQQFRQALEYYPNDSWSLTNLGYALEQQGRYDEAVDAYWQATMADPDDEMAWENYVNLSAWLEEQRAVEDWDRGIDLLDQELWADAEYYFCAAVERDPYNVAAHENLG